MEEEKRIGNFTSSQMHRLCASLKSGKPSVAFYSYVDDIISEVNMGRSTDVQINTKPLKWGSLMEVVLFQKKEIELKYRMAHKLTIVHDKIKHYSGTPDLINIGEKVGEIKCYYPKNFEKLSRCILKKDVELFKKEFQKEYWQCISNAVLCDVDNAEIIAYMPYRDELIDIIKAVEDTNLLEGNNLNPSDYYFITHDDIETLPFLPNDSKMSNINRFEFIVPIEDKNFLIERIKEAGKLLDEELKH